MIVKLPHFFGSAAPESGEWSWVLRGADQADEATVSETPSAVDQPRFATRLDAQGWLGEHLDELRTASLTTAQLTHRGQAVGEPVNLEI